MKVKTEFELWRSLQQRLDIDTEGLIDLYPNGMYWFMQGSFFNIYLSLCKEIKFTKKSDKCIIYLFCTNIFIVQL